MTLETEATAAYGGPTEHSPQTSLTQLWQDVAAEFTTRANFVTQNTAGRYNAWANGTQVFVEGRWYVRDAASDEYADLLGWKATTTDTVRLMLLWGQSNAAQNNPRTVTRDNAIPNFPTTPAHAEFTRVDNGNGTYNITFNGRTAKGVLKWNPATSAAEPIGVSERNNTAVGAACRHYDETGEQVVIVDISEGSKPIERFLDSSTVSITGATQANPVVLSIADMRLIPQNTDLDVTIAGVTGMTGLNGGPYVVKNPSPAWTAWRTSDVAVAGTVEVFEQNGTTPVDGTGFGAYLTGGTLSAHHLLDKMDSVVPTVFTQFGKSSFDFVVDFQGEANEGATVFDLRSTTGGVTTFKEYKAKRVEMINLLTSKGYVNSETKITSHQLNSIGSGKGARNDVITSLNGEYANLAVTPSRGYTAADGSHIDDKWGLGYYGAGRTLRGLNDAGVIGGGVFPDYAERLLRFDGSLGGRSAIKNLDEQTFDMSSMTQEEYTEYLTDTLFVIRSSKIILPALQYSMGDIGLKFSVIQWSASGTTPGEANGSSVIEGNFDFNRGNGRTSTGSVVIPSNEVDEWFKFTFFRNGNFIYSTDSYSFGGTKVINSDGNIQHIGYPTLSLADQGHAVNTANKRAGLEVFNVTLKRPVYATGSNAADPWNFSDGTVAHTPA